MRITQTGGSKGKNFLRPKPAQKSERAKPSLGKTKAANLGLSLPEKASPPILDIGKYTILAYGERKIGKTSITSKFKKAIFLKTEPGGKGLNIVQCPPDPMQVIKDWYEFDGYVDLIRESKDYDTVIVDTLDIAYEYCMHAKCDELGISHPNELGYGQGWDAVKQEFIRVMNKLITSGKGVIFISHAEDKDFQKPNGERYSKLIPSMSKAASKWAAGIADIIVYFGYYGSKRFMTIAGSETLEAGHRIEDRFICTTGEPVHSIPMGKNSKEGYDNFIKAFDNKQQKPYTMSAEETGLSDVRAPMIKKGR